MYWFSWPILTSATNCTDVPGLNSNISQIEILSLAPIQTGYKL